MALRRWRRIGLLIVVLLLGYLAFWPVPIEPVAWRAPRAPELVGPFAPNERLREVEWLGRGRLQGPEATAIDAQGRVTTGTRDGRIVRFDPTSGNFETLATPGGRPLGLSFAADGTLWICVAGKGLMRLTPDGELRLAASGFGGAPFGFVDDLDVAPDGTVYFTDASSRFGPPSYREDILEHGARGRLFAFAPATGTTELVLDGLEFANGVALAGDGASLLVNETGAYRIRRVWLNGERRGQSEPFVENLPGFPDNVTWSAARGVFWVALFSPRLASLDLLAPHPWLRKVVYRLPLWTQPQPVHRAWALAFDPEGRVIENLQSTAAGAYAPITSVRERGGTLWLGSLERDALGRLPAPPLR